MDNDDKYWEISGNTNYHGKNENLPELTTGQGEPGVESASSSNDALTTRNCSWKNFSENQLVGEYNRNRRTSGVDVPKMVKSRNKRWSSKGKSSVGFATKQREDCAPVARVEPMKMVKDVGNDDVFSVDSCQSILDANGNIFFASKESVGEKIDNSRYFTSDSSNSYASVISKKIRSHSDDAFAATWEKELEYGNTSNLSSLTRLSHSSSGSSCTRLVSKKMRCASENTFTVNQESEFEAADMTVEPNVVATWDKVCTDELGKDGTELDFNVVVFSQDETDSKDSSSSDFGRGTGFNIARPLLSSDQLQPASTPPLSKQLEYVANVVNQCQGEVIQRGGNYTSDNLSNYEECNSGSGSSNYIKNTVLERDSQTFESCRQSAGQDGFSILNEMLGNVPNPSEIKIDSQSKKEQYLKCVTREVKRSNLPEENRSESHQTTVLSAWDTQRSQQPVYTQEPPPVQETVRHFQFVDRNCKPYNIPPPYENQTQMVNSYGLGPRTSQRQILNLAHPVRRGYCDDQNIYRRIDPCNVTTENQIQNIGGSAPEITVLEYMKQSNNYVPGRDVSNTSSFSNEKQFTFRPFQPAYDVSVLATKAYTPGFIDSHCHLDFLFQRVSHSGTLKTFQLKCKDSDPFPVSFEGCVAIFCEPWTFRKISWWEDIICESNVWAAFGCHPHYVSKFGLEEEAYLRHAIQNSKAVALGEIGLDYSERNNENIDLQQEVFRQQLKIALEFQKPIVIHCREAHKDCISILKDIVPHDYIIHRHCFTDSWEEAQEWMDTFSNLFIGFTALVTQTNRRARIVQEVVRRMPLERILLETDAPYFRPYCVGPSHPGMAIHVAAQIAHLKNIDIEVVLQHARENTRKMYGI